MPQTGSRFSNLFWQLYGGWVYDRLCLIIPYVKYLRQIMHSLRKHLSPNARVLDLGGGSGNLWTLLTHSDTYWKVVLFDRSTTMLKRAARKLRNKKNIQCYEGDATKRLPFNEQNFDCVVLGNFLYTLASPEMLIKEVYRILTPEGYIILTDPKPTYRISRILGAHVGLEEERPNNFWSNLRLLIKVAFKDFRLLCPWNFLAFAFIIYSNVQIARNNHQYLSLDTLADLLKKSHFKILTQGETYADQNHFVIAQKI